VGLLEYILLNFFRILQHTGRNYGKNRKVDRCRAANEHGLYQWTQFEEFPRFMKGVNSVKQLDKRLHWEAEIGGKIKEWDARITDQVPDHLIAWQSEGGEYTSGAVNFTSVSPNCTRIKLELMYDPEGFVDKTGGALGVVSSRVEGDLIRFKEFIENKGHETGAWRGTIRE